MRLVLRLGIMGSSLLVWQASLTMRAQPWNRAEPGPASPSTIKTFGSTVKWVVYELSELGQLGSNNLHTHIYI